MGCYWSSGEDYGVPTNTSQRHTSHLSGHQSRHRERRSSNAQLHNTQSGISSHGYQMQVMIPSNPYRTHNTKPGTRSRAEQAKQDVLEEYDGRAPTGRRIPPAKGAYYP